MSIIKTPITIALTVILLLGVGYVAWEYWNDESKPLRPLNPYEFQVVQNSCTHFANELEGTEGLYDLVILPIHEKRKRNIPEMLAEYLSNNTRINVLYMEEVYETVREKKEGLDEKELAKFREREFLEEHYARGKNGWGVLELRVKDFKSGKRGRGAGLHLDGELKVYGEDGTAKTKDIKDFEQYITTKFSLIYFSAWMQSHSPWMRMVVWVLFVIFLPLTTTSLIAKITSRQSNKQNAYMLLAFTSIDMFFAYLLTGFQIYSPWAGSLLFLGFLASSIYNYEMCDLIDDWS